MDLTMMDVKQIAVRMNVSERTVRRWRDKGILPKPTVRNGRKLLWSRRLIERCVRNGYLARSGQKRTSDD